MKCLATVILLVCSSTVYGEAAPGEPVIVIGLPANSREPIYSADILQEIKDFQISLAMQLMEDNNTVLVLAEDEVDVPPELPHVKASVLDSSMQNLGALRDVATVYISMRAVNFMYKPSYLSLEEWELTQEKWDSFARQVGIPPAQSVPLVLDGGNVVHNDKNKVIVSSRVLRDNPDIPEREVVDQLERAFQSQVAIIPENPEDRTTGHADGLVAFIDENVVAYRNIKNATFARSVENALNAAFSDSVEMVQLPSLYPKPTGGFTSSCGTHVDLLYTGAKLYVPTFGDNDEAKQKNGLTTWDEQALNAIEKASTKEVKVVPVPQRVCQMGGSLRHLSWMVSGPNAEKFIGKN